MRFIDRFFLSVVCFLSVTAICTSQLQPTIAGTSSTAGAQFNNGMILLGITGNEIDTLPPVLTFSEECGDVLCRATELRDYGVDPNISAQVDQGIFDIFIRDSVNSNYKLELITSPKISPLPKITTFDFKLVVKDRTQDAKAVLVVIDRAGKFVEKTFSYKGFQLPEVSHSELSLRVFKADSTVTNTIYIKNPNPDTMYIDSIYLRNGTVFTITAGKILSRFALAPGRRRAITIDYTSQKGLIGDTTPDNDSLCVIFAACRSDRFIPLEGRFATSSIKISPETLVFNTTVVDQSRYGDIIGGDEDSVIITNTSNSTITIDSIIVDDHRTFSILRGNISSALQLAGGESHTVIIRFDWVNLLGTDFSNTRYGVQNKLRINIRGESERLVYLEGHPNHLFLAVDESATSQHDNLITITPNPAGQNAVVTMNNSTLQHAFLRVYDAIGREMPACATELDNATGVLIPNITALPIGTYRLVATTAAGTVLSTKLLLIQR